MAKRVIRTESAEETKALGAEFCKTVKKGGVLLLYGDLGGGKTTFTQGFARELGIVRHVLSPTFLMMRTYEIPRYTNGKFYHLDLYRAVSENDVQELGLTEVMENSKNIVVIEWAERLEKLIPKARTELHFEFVDENVRKIAVDTYE